MPLCSAMDKNKENKIMKIKMRWIVLLAVLLALMIPGSAAADPIFTAAEKQYITRHGVIYVAGNPDAAPAEYYEHGHYRGVLPELFQKIGEKSGLTFTYINDKNEQSTYADNKQAEIISGLTEAQVSELQLPGSMSIMVSPRDHSQKLYIGFTGIAGNHLVSIIGKSIADLDGYEMQEVVLAGTNDGLWRGLSRQTIWMLILFTAAFLFFFLASLILNHQNTLLRYTDSMTGTESYVSLKKRYDKRFASSRTKFNYYVVNFKLETDEIVQLYGYEEITAVMKDLAFVLKKNLAQEEGFARLYDDTIIMVGTVSSQSIVESRITGLMDTMTRHLMEIGRQYELGITAGIYYLQGFNDSFEQSAEYAMQARVRAAARRKRIGICTEELLKKIGKENRMEKEVLSALHDREFIPYIQPIVNISTKAIDCGQILARWDSKRYGLVRPDLFLSVLEKHNLLDDLDFQMFESTVEFLAEMNRRHRKMITLFVSFSRGAVEKEDFYDRILDVIDNNNVSPRFIGVIINNDNMDMGLNSLKASIGKLKDSGITVLLDDFDKSPYALRSVNNLAIDYVKISRDMLVGLAEEGTEKVLEGFINTLHDVNVRVICKDFTDENYLPVLERIGCDGVQGNKYYFPMPTEEFLKLDPAESEEAK